MRKFFYLIRLVGFIVSAILVAPFAYILGHRDLLIYLYLRSYEIEEEGDRLFEERL